MATVNGLTAEAMSTIRDGAITDANIVGGDLVLTHHDGSTDNLGNVIGPQGTTDAATTVTPGLVELATDAVAITGTDAAKAVTPHALTAVITPRVTLTGVVASNWTSGLAPVVLDSGQLVTGTKNCAIGRGVNVLPGDKVVVEQVGGSYFITTAALLTPDFPRIIKIPAPANLINYADLLTAANDSGQPYKRLGVTRTTAGCVWLSGFMSGGAISANTVLFTLDPAFRPLQQKRFSVGGAGSTVGMIVEVNGNVYCDTALTNGITLNVSWTNDPAIVWTNLTLSSGFTQSTLTGAAVPRIGIDTVGRVWLEGLVAYTALGPIATIPLAFRWTNNGGVSSGQLYTCYDASVVARFGRIDYPVAWTTGAAPTYLSAVGGGATSTGLSLDSIHYLADGFGAQQVLTLGVGSAYGSGYGPPSFVQYLDQSVGVFGLHVTTGGVMGTLPQGARPLERLRDLKESNAAQSSVDLIPNGGLTEVNGTTWTAWSGFQFVAGQ